MSPFYKYVFDEACTAAVEGCIADTARPSIWTNFFFASMPISPPSSLLARSWSSRYDQLSDDDWAVWARVRPHHSYHWIFWNVGLWHGDREYYLQRPCPHTSSPALYPPNRRVPRGYPHQISWEFTWTLESTKGFDGSKDSAFLWLAGSKGSSPYTPLVDPKGYLEVHLADRYCTALG